jgi:methionyl-tRNA formyltransferase
MQKKIVILTRNEPLLVPLYLFNILKRKHENVLKVYIDAKPSPHLSKMQLLRLCGVLTFIRLTLKYILYKIYGVFGLRRKGGIFYSVISELKHYGIDYQVGFEARSDNFKNEILSLKPDVLLSVANSQIIPSELLNIEGLLCLNTHGSLLPKYRGILTAFWMLLEGESKGGVTIHKMTSKIDSGAIINQKEFEITTADTIMSVYEKVARHGSELILNTIEQIEKNEQQETRNLAGGRLYSVPTNDEISEFLKKGKKFA